MKDELLSLATRVERLSGPCRETDFLIAEAVSDIPEHWAGVRVRTDRPWEFADERGVWPAKWEGGQPAYTASIDAAMTLYVIIPERVPSDARKAAAEALRQRTEKSDG